MKKETGGGRNVGIKGEIEEAKKSPLKERRWKTRKRRIERKKKIEA